MLEKICEVVTSEIRPYLLTHGGDVKVLDYRDGQLTVRLGGQCVGCPSADLSTKYMIQEVLQNHFPEIREVVLDDGIDPALLAQARELLFGKKGEN